MTREKKVKNLQLSLLIKQITLHVLPVAKHKALPVLEVEKMQGEGVPMLASNCFEHMEMVLKNMLLANNGSFDVRANKLLTLIFDINENYSLEELEANQAAFLQKYVGLESVKGGYVDNLLYSKLAAYDCKGNMLQLEKYPNITMEEIPGFYDFDDVLFDNSVRLAISGYGKCWNKKSCKLQGITHLYNTAYNMKKPDLAKLKMAEAGDEQKQRKDRVADFILTLADNLNIKVKLPGNVLNETKVEEELRAQGFPESYIYRVKEEIVAANAVGDYPLENEDGEETDRSITDKYAYDRWQQEELEDYAARIGYVAGNNASQPIQHMARCIATMHYKYLPQDSFKRVEYCDQVDDSFNEYLDKQEMKDQDLLTYLAEFKEQKRETVQKCLRWTLKAATEVTIDQVEAAEAKACGVETA